MIVMIFMAVTSSGASEMLAVSSLFTFDIYRRYIKPKVRTNLTSLHCPVAIYMTSYWQDKTSSDSSRIAWQYVRNAAPSCVTGTAPKQAIPPHLYRGTLQCF